MSSAWAAVYDMPHIRSKPVITLGQSNSYGPTSASDRPVASKPRRRHVGAAEAWQ